MKLAVIGAGNMGGAIATAVIQAELVPPKNLLLIEPDELYSLGAAGGH